MATLPTLGQKNWGGVLNDWLKTIGDESVGGLHFTNLESDLSSAPFNSLPDNTTVFVKGVKKLFKKETGTYVEKLNFSSAFSSTTAPSDPDIGDTYYNTSDDAIYYWDGSTWSIGSGGLSPSGSIKMFAGPTAPDGWLLCKGQAVSRTTYSALFSVIGTIYGNGDGSTTFNLPNLQGKAVFGASDSDSSFTFVTVGGTKTKNLSHAHTTGDASLSVAQLPSHNHGINDPGHNHAVNDPGHGHSTQGAADLGGGETSAYYRTGTGTATIWPPIYANTTGIWIGASGTGISTQATGSGGTHNHGNSGGAGSATQDVMNPYMAMNYIIKA